MVVIRAGGIVRLMEDDDLRVRLGGGWRPSPLNVVLVGGRNSRRSCVGNLILGREAFEAAESPRCSRRLDVVGGQWVAVVNTPGWWCDFGARDTCELVRREIVSSVSLCSPGPHVVLITVKVSSAFSERRRRALEEHVALLGGDVWGHCMVVFTCADRGAEEVVQRGGQALRWLSDRCGQRCHSVVLSRDGGASELLQRILQLVADNGHRVLEVQEELLQEAAEQRSREEEGARQRRVRARRQRSLLRERLLPQTDIRMVLVGAKGSGKTSTLNTILGREGGGGLRRTAQCLVGRAVVFGRRVTVVDTPGWWMNFFCDESPAFERRELLLSPSLCPPGPHVFLLVIRPDRAFGDACRRAAQEHLQLLGEHIWSRVIVLFSFGDWLGATGPEQVIESEGRPLQRLVELCGNRYHVVDNAGSRDGFQVRELIGKVEELLAGSGGHYQVQRKVMEQLEERKRREEQRAEERRRRKERRRQAARSRREKLGRLSEVRLVLVGGRKTGKSSCGNTILRRESFPAGSHTSSCSEHRVTVSGRAVAVLDAPDGFSVTSDLLLGPCAVLVVVNASASFTDAHGEAAERQLAAGGGQAWSRAAVLFSHGDWLGDSSIEQRIESEEALRRLVERCGSRYHVLDNKRRDGGQVDRLVELVEETLGGDGSESRQTSLSSAGGAAAGGGGAGAGAAGCGTLDADSSCRRCCSVPVLPAGLRLTVNLPVLLPPGALHHLRADSQVSLLSLRYPTMPLAPPHSHLAPTWRPSESGRLQTPVDQQGPSSLDELEAFIDSYSQVVWEQTLDSPGPPRPPTEQEDPQEEGLWRLELLKEIRGDVAELRRSVELSWRTIRELQGGAAPNTQPW
ncbi:GTPase IMAP family member 8-like [Pempheris klunzingeri]|uniref:GTPase IMAP family member 8-like n=1 Tax=Pempheris klunzingeri TaxID=3127111 RepID=UPI00397F2F7A